jgi:hypothetical protein
MFTSWVNNSLSMEFGVWNPIGIARTALIYIGLHPLELVQAVFFSKTYKHTISGCIQAVIHVSVCVALKTMQQV